MIYFQSLCWVVLYPLVSIRYSLPCAGCQPPLFVEVFLVSEFWWIGKPKNLVSTKFPFLSSLSSTSSPDLTFSVKILSQKFHKRQAINFMNVSFRYLRRFPTCVLCWSFRGVWVLMDRSTPKKLASTLFFFQTLFLQDFWLDSFRQDLNLLFSLGAS